MKVLACVVSMLVALPVFAAIPPKILSGTGSIHGGLAGSGFTLMDLRRTADNKKKIERLVFDVGDAEGKPQRGWPGYYHAELKQNPPRLVLDFAQMPSARLDQRMIDRRLKGSIAVTRSAMTLDPVDNTLNLTLDLKKDTRVRVYQVMGKKSTSKVVVDLVAAK